MMIKRHGGLFCKRKHNFIVHRNYFDRTKETNREYEIGAREFLTLHNSQIHTRSGSHGVLEVQPLCFLWMLVFWVM